MQALAFQPLRSRLYTSRELFEGFAPARPRSYTETADFRIYLQYVRAGRFAPTDDFIAMMEAVHDNAIREATEDFLKSPCCPLSAVGFMGGHHLARNSPVYAVVAALSRELARRGYLPLSGGGPGAMEATHLGALFAHESAAALSRALAELGRVPKLPRDLEDIVSKEGVIDGKLAARAHAWLLPAYRIAKRVRRPGESLAIPTWLYGHEPTTALATRVAKYFQNSIREDRLLSIATHGVICVEGSAGTIQEIFQDAALNFYRILGDFSPMIFLGSDLWSNQLPVVKVLASLFKPSEFKKYVLVTDEPAEVLAFLERFRKKETPSERVVRLKRCQSRV